MSEDIHMCPHDAIDCTCETGDCQFPHQNGTELFLKQIAALKASLADARETLAQAWVAVCGTGCATTWPTGTERPHTLLCNQIRAALLGVESK